jgi:transcriptional regulator with XRE-family HTH domain
MPSSSFLGVTLGVTALGLATVTEDVAGQPWDLTVDHARVETLRRGLGVHLALYRSAAGLSQPELGQIIGRTRSMISKIEHGTRGMPAELWKITDDVCHADGALVAGHNTLADAEGDYRARCRTYHRQAQQREAQARVDAFQASPMSSLCDGGNEGDLWSNVTGGVEGELAKELMAVVTKLIRSLGRRDAMQIVGWALASVGLSGVDPDEHTRVIHAVESPSRVDAQVVNTLALTLAACKRQEDKLGPSQILDTVVAQHQLVLRLQDGCPPQLRKPLSLVDSNMACSIGWYLIEMGHHATGRRYLERARKASHRAGNPAYAAYAACYISHAAFLRGDTPTALDAAAAARSLAARTDDYQLKAFAEQQASAAYALDCQYAPCMAAYERARELLASPHNRSATDSPAYWVDHGIIGCKHSALLLLLDKPTQALNVATAAHTQFDRSAYVRMYGFCQVRLGHALVLSKEITEAAHILGNAASQAKLSTRLTQELHTTRAIMQPWATTHAVQTLDAQLEACGLLPLHAQPRYR